MEQRMVIGIKPPAPPKWSMVDAFREGDTRCAFAMKSLDGFDRMPLEDRLEAADRANAVFRYVYTRGEDQKGRDFGFFKIPLLRDYNADIDGIRIRISGEEYREATRILKGAGRLQRIVRAIPYSQLRKDVLAHLAQEGVMADDAVLVGIDRGGRVPTLIMKEALGLPRAFFFKVDQGGGMVDEERLGDIAKRGILRGRYVLFIDSTVDSGRQIHALEPYFEGGAWAERIGHTGWVVVGSNEDGETLGHHLNVNWGVDPDRTFEDDPLLMGVDYADGSHTRVKPAPSKTASDIRKALREVPRGIVLDTHGIVKRYQIVSSKDSLEKKIGKMTSSAGWQKALARYQKRGREPEDIADIPQRKPNCLSRQMIAVIGTGSLCDISSSEAAYIAMSLVHNYVIRVGTPRGNPGELLRTVQSHGLRNSDFTLYQPAYAAPEDETGDMDNDERIIIYAGETKSEFRRHLIHGSYAVLALGGERGTLVEAVMALEHGIPVVAVKGYGAVGDYIAHSKWFKRYYNLHVVDSIRDAVAKANELYEDLR